MPRIILQHPIYTIDHQKLFSAGDLLTQETLEAVIRAKKVRSYPTQPLFSYGTVREDCLTLLSHSPYSAIFSDPKEVRELFKIFETVHFPIPILQSMDYFKREDPYTYSHILMVFALSTLLAKDLISDYQERIRVSATGPTHDLGKICIPLYIMKKKTPLTQKERSTIEHHAVAGYVLLNYYYHDHQSLACKVALEHHERKDGLGYPRGIKLKDPLVEIMAVSDIYDALVVPRPYRSTAYDNRTALDELTRMAEQKHIGWDVVKALVAHNRKVKPHYSDIKISDEKRGLPPSNNFYGITAIENETVAGKKEKG